MGTEHQHEPPTGTPSGIRGGDPELMARLVARLAELDATLAVAESLTGGLAIASAVEQPEAGEVVAGGMVAYTPDAKRRLLGVDGIPVVSRQCATALCQAVSRELETSAALAFTGVAGPGPLEGHAPGLVYVAARWQTYDIVAELRLGDMTPHEIRMASISFGAELLMSLIDDHDDAQLGS